MTDYTGIGLIISQIATAYVLIAKASRDARESKEDRARNAAAVQSHLIKQDAKIDEVHKSTNGKMEQLLELTAKSSKAEGVADEKTRHP